jgi:hypothetical protein
MNLPYFAQVRDRLAETAASARFHPVERRAAQ